MMAFSLIQELLSALSAECPAPAPGRGGLAGRLCGAFLPHPPSSGSFCFVGNARSGPENWSLLELFMFNMEIVVSDVNLSVTLAAVLLASGRSGEKMHLHVSAQLCCLSYRSSENTSIWIAGSRTAFSLSS